MYQPIPQRSYPPAWRVVLAFFIAPAAGAVIMAFVAPAYDGLSSAIERLLATAELFALLGAYPSTLILGVPAYFILRRHLDPRPLSCAFAGAAVAAIPWIFLVLASTPSSASIGGRATVIDGQYTAYGWLENAQFIGGIALVGWAAGLIFWAIAAAGAGLSLPGSAPSEADEVVAGH
jgi:hypothetical protein